MLNGLRVIDFTHAVSGPYCTMILGDLGAEIIKIEPPEGESSRFTAGPFLHGENFFNLAFNRNKKCVTLDIMTDSGREAFLDLTKISDVIVTNYRAGALERAGISDEKMRNVNTKLIICEIAGYNSSGKYRDKPAYDIVVLAESGALSIAGDPEGRPVRPGIPLADMAASFYAVIGILAALNKRAMTGKGTRIDIPLLSATMSMMAYQFSNYALSGNPPKALDRSGHLLSIPYGIYKTQDGYMALGACWPRIARVIGAEWLIEDPRFKDIEERVKRRVELNEIIEEHLKKAPAEDWVELCKIEDVPAGVVRSLDEVVVSPEVMAEDIILTMQHSLGGEIRLVGNPINNEFISEKNYTPPPTLGQHTNEILAKLLGYSEEQVEKLKEEEKKHSENRSKHISKLH